MKMQFDENIRQRFIILLTCLIGLIALFLFYWIPLLVVTQKDVINVRKMITLIPIHIGRDLKYLRRIMQE